MYVSLKEKVERATVKVLDFQGQTLATLNVPKEAGLHRVSWDLTVQQTLADVARDNQATREPELLRSYTTRHESGLHVLPAAGTPELAALIQGDQIDLILETAREAYDSVVVDAGSHLDDVTMSALEHADAVIVTVYGEMGALKAVHLLLDVLAEQGSVPAKTTFVLNNVFAKEGLKMRAIEGALATPVAAELPYDPFVYLKAVNEGIPVVRGAPRSIAADRLVRLAAVAFGEDTGSVVAAHDNQQKSRRFGILRRA